MKNNKLYGTTFYGNEASDYAKKNGRLDYATLAKSFDAVLNSNIMKVTANIGFWKTENGSEEYYEDTNGNIYTYEEKEERIEVLEAKIEKLETFIRTAEIEEEIEEIQEDIEALENAHYDEIFQYYIVSDEGARILKEWTNEILFYNEELNMYVWGVTHYGTSWSCVLTDIQLNCGEEAFN